MIPDKISIVEHMPINKNGKIDRSKIFPTPA
jgi:non-ribosomal peptide synthetase component E (peptide arylation enzyme)